ncbi:MAG: arylesterase [Desulfamplus sp.]|nr:arylesterase [Desulfamplus sp.]
MIITIKSSFPLLIFSILSFMLFMLMIPPSPIDAEEGQPSILFLGDSLTEGYGVSREEAFPSLVSEKLAELGYSHVRLINAGISGSTTASALSRLRWYKRVKPRVLFLALGANDGLRGLPLDAMEKNLDDTIKLALKWDMKVILAGMEIPPNYGAQYTDGFRSVYQSLAKKHDIILMPFLLKDVGGVDTYNQGDGIHPNARGYKIVADNVLPYIVDVLEKITE